MDAERRRFWVACVAPMLALLALGNRAHAHPSPAEPPVFIDEGCIVVLDKRSEPVWHMDYLVPFEDTEFGVDDIVLPDAKTHQFFAIAGATFLGAGEHVVVPFAADTGERLRLPLWLSQEEVQRAADGVTAADMTEFSPDQVERTDIMEHSPEIEPLLRPLVDGTERVPITGRQAELGVDWDLGDVPVGAYQILSYIFSPPYNGWEVRPGLIKVVDDGEGPPVVALASVTAQVFQGQGRRITGCVDAPSGSTLEVAVHDPSAPADEWETWVAPQPIDGSTFEACLLNPGIDGVMSVRVEVVTPDGQTATAHGEQDITLFSRKAQCQAGETLCCPEPAPTPPAPQVAARQQDAGISNAPSAPAINSAGPTNPSETMQVDVPAQAAPADNDGETQTTASTTTDGCHCAVPGSTSPQFGWPWLVLLALVRRWGSTGVGTWRLNS